MKNQYLQTIISKTNLLNIKLKLVTKFPPPFHNKFRNLLQHTTAMSRKDKQLKSDCFAKVIIVYNENVNERSVISYF